jgi:hypothetical protein
MIRFDFILQAESSISIASIPLHDGLRGGMTQALWNIYILNLKSVYYADCKTTPQSSSSSLHFIHQQRVGNGC